MEQHWFFTIIYVLPLLAAGLSLLVAFHAWRKRDIPGSISLSGLMIAVFIWSILDAVEKLATTIDTKIIISQFMILGTSSVPVLYFIFCARYSHQDRWLTRGRLFLIWLVPITTIGVVSSNNYHNFHWSGYSLNEATNLLTYHYGPWFWISTASSYIFLLSGIIILIRSVQGIKGRYRTQIFLVIMAAIFPWAANIIHILRVIPIQGFDPTPLTLALSGLLLAINISEFRLIDLTPIARSKLVDTLQDTIIVIDQQGNISDLNPAACRACKISYQDAIQKPASTVLKQWPYLENYFSNHNRSVTELKVIPDLENRLYDSRISTLKNPKGKITGHLIVLRDITEERRAEEDRSRMVAVIEQASESILITDLEGNIIYANPSFEAISGYAFQEVIGKNANILQSGKHRPEFYQALWSTITRGEIWSGTIINKHKDGSEYHEASTIFPIKKKGGMTTNYASVTRDISAEVRAEKAIQLFTDQLTNLHKISIELSLMDTFEELCRHIVLWGCQRVGYDRIGLWLIDPQNPGYLVGTFGIDEDGQLRDEQHLRQSLTDFPNYSEFLKIETGVLHKEHESLRNHKGEIVGTGELAVAGIWDKEKLIGYISTDNLLTAQRFSEQQRTILVLFSQTISNLIIRKREDQALHAFSKLLATLHEVSVELSQAHSLNEMCILAVHLGRHRLGFDRIRIWLTDLDDPQTIKGSYGIDNTGRILDERSEVHPIETNAIISRISVGTDRVYYQQQVDLVNGQNEVVGLGDVAAAALWDGMDIIGYMIIDNLFTQEPITSYHLDLIGLFAQAISNLSTRIRITQEISEKALHQELLNEITHTAIQQTDFQEMLKTLANRLGELFRADGCYIALWDGNQQSSKPGAVFGPFQDLFTSQHQPNEPSLTQSVLSTGKVTTIDDVSTSSELSEFNALRPVASSIMGLPLIANEQKLGVAWIAFTQTHEFTKEEVILGEQAARQVALAILKTRLLDEAEVRAREAETLRQASAAVAATLRRDVAIERILEELNRVVPYDSASVQLMVGGELEIVGERGFKDPTSVIGLRFPLSVDTPNSIVLENGEPLIIQDAPEVYSEFKKPPHDHIHGWMGIPLKVHDDIIGMLALDSIQPDRFTQDHERLATAFADQVAIALENTRLFEETQWLALHDSLTGLYNRRHFMSLAWSEFQRSLRYGTPLSVIMLDIDHFKRVNDTFGHLIGDQVLGFIADLCETSLRVNDLIGRYGGEEFVILLPETSATIAQDEIQNQEQVIEPAKVVAERLRTTVEESIIETDRGGIKITISLGISELSPGIHAIDQLIDQADQALLQAKQTGRNRVVIWNED